MPGTEKGQKGKEKGRRGRDGTGRKEKGWEGEKGSVKVPYWHFFFPLPALKSTEVTETYHAVENFFYLCRRKT